MSSGVQETVENPSANGVQTYVPPISGIARQKQGKDQLKGHGDIRYYKPNLVH
jgi:hypothetical protein